MDFPLEQAFLERLERDDWPAAPSISRDTPVAPGIALANMLKTAFEAQLSSRLLDYAARRLQASGDGFYTIGSAGHEAMAAVALALRPSDPAFLHYRDAAFFIARASQVKKQKPLRDLLLSLGAHASDPIAGGRHKVLGSRHLNIPPQTSTIASHLPKAVGCAYSFGLWKRLGRRQRRERWPRDSLVICSFGDASLNHSSAQGALNTASWLAYRDLPLPLLLVCEDNGLGISVPSPPGWVEARLRQQPKMPYWDADGRDLLASLQQAEAASHWCRQHKRPAILHLRCLRLMGHAGADRPESYLSLERIRQDEAQDPLFYSAGLMRQLNLMSATDITALYRNLQNRIEGQIRRQREAPRINSREELSRSLLPPKRRGSHQARRIRTEPSRPMSMAQSLNLGLRQALQAYPHLLIAGQDIGRKGGVYGVTQGLQKEFGPHRVMDSLLDEQSILGMGIGLAHNGLLPVLEIQFLAYLHNALDQLRGEAATLPFFSQGQFSNPMLIRIASFAYQKGFGGHFHNDNAIAALREIPGLLLACPSDGLSAAALLRESLRLVDEEQRVVVLLEPIALYHRRDLREPGDELCLRNPDEDIPDCPVGEPRRLGQGRDLAIISYGNGYQLAHAALPEIEALGIDCRLIDLPWLSGIDHEKLYQQVKDCQGILILDECRKTASLNEELMTALAERGLAAPRLQRLCADDCFIPIGPASTLTLPDRAQLMRRIQDMRLGHL